MLNYTDSVTITPGSTIHPFTHHAHLARHTKVPTARAHARMYVWLTVACSGGHFVAWTEGKDGGGRAGGGGEGQDTIWQDAGDSGAYPALYAIFIHGIRPSPLASPCPLFIPYITLR